MINGKIMSKYLISILDKSARMPILIDDIIELKDDEIVGFETLIPVEIKVFKRLCEDCYVFVKNGYFLKGNLTNRIDERKEIASTLILSFKEYFNELDIK
jgi:hypothetical protein